MELIVLTPQDLESVFESNPEQFKGYDLPYFLVSKVRPFGSYSELYIVDVMLHCQLDPAHSNFEFTYEKMNIGVTSKAGLDYIRARYPHRVFIDRKLHS